jgi:hypothetical protein
VLPLLLLLLLLLVVVVVVVLLQWQVLARRTWRALCSPWYVTTSSRRTSCAGCASAARTTRSPQQHVQTLRPDPPARNAHSQTTAHTTR